MFTFEKLYKEDQAIQTLLLISQNEEKGISAHPEFSVPHIESINQSVKKRQKAAAEEDYQVLSPWEGSENEKLSKPNNQDGKDQKRVSKTRDSNLTNKRTPRFRGGKLNSSSSTADEKFQFCHFEESKEHITHYREVVTFSTILDYRNGISNTSIPNHSGGNCKKCDSDGILKQCQCSGGTPSSSGVYYVETSDTVKRHNILAAMESLSRNSSADETTLYRNRKCSSKDRLCRKTSTSTGKLWKSAAAKIPNRTPTGPLKSIQSFASCKHKSCTKTKTRDIRIKTGNESTEALRIYTSPKAYGPRMGSNRPPPNDASEIRGGTPPSQLINCLRPKVPQAAIPNKNTSFQACIMPMNKHTTHVSVGSNISKTP
ncbi:uncharacterized protein [Clytia hemisphaerica]|uniref:Uncharacterized protein n=1 Tax=Clytia hemisphaerica TaxID=252671 RepID=A0A7M5WKV4_9CNID